jgi:hypothetical protein
MIIFSVVFIFILSLVWVLGFCLKEFLRLQLSLTLQMLLGIMGLNFYALIMSLFCPLNTITLFYLLPLISFYIFKNKSSLKTISFKEKRSLALLSLPILLYGFLLAQEPPLNYDTGLYHYQAIIWGREYPVVPGLGNVFSGLGYNNSVLSLHSLLSFKDLFGQDLFTLNFLLYFIGVSYFVDLILKSVTWKESNMIVLANVLLLVAFVSLCENISSPTPDYAANSILILLLSIALNNNDTNESNQLSVFVILAFYLITIKLSMIPILFLSGYCIVRLWRLHGEHKKFYINTAFVSIYILVWCAKTVIITGWLIYPFPAIDLFNFDWKVTDQQMSIDSIGFTGWSRYPGIDVSISSKMSFMQWFPNWWQRANWGKGYMIISILSILLFIIVTIKKAISTRSNLFWIGVSIIAGFIFWFIKAPDFRFSIGFIFHLMFLPLYLLKYRTDLETNPQKTKSILLLVYALYIVYIYNQNLAVIKANICPDIMSGRWKLPKSLDYVGRQSMDSFYSHNLKFYYPKNVKQTGDMRCYDFCIPCLTNKDTTLLPRGKSVRNGFKRIQYSE